MSVRRARRRDPLSGVTKHFWIVDVDLQLSNGQRQRVRKVSPIQTRRGAEEYERDLRGTILSGKFKNEEVGIPTFEEFSKEFMITHSQVHNKKSMVVGNTSILDLHLLPAMGRLKLDQIDEYRIAKFRAEQKDKGLQHSTVNNHLILLRTILGKAHEWKKISSVPKVRKLSNTLGKPRFLSFEEAERLFDAAKSEVNYCAAVVLALNTGMRLGELIGLQWDDIDLVAGRLTVQRTCWQGNVGTPKSGKERTLPLNAHAAMALKAHRHLRGPWVFCKDDGSIRSHGEFAMALRRIRKRAGLQGFEWHALRHTFASHLTMRGVPLRAIQDLLGHAGIQMTLRYSHLSPGSGKAAVDALLKEIPAELRQPDGNREHTKAGAFR